MGKYADLCAHAQRRFREAVNVNKLTYQRVKRNLLIIMYKLKDLRRLKKTELVNLAKENSLLGNSSLSRPRSITKEQLLQVFVSSGLCQSTSQQTPDTSSTDALPVELQSEFLHYRPLTDALLVTVPNCSFAQLYSYFCGSNEQSMKSLDRAAKHSSAGDVGDFKICQVGL